MGRLLVKFYTEFLSFQAIGGVLDEFIFSPRLDNLLNAYCATTVSYCLLVHYVEEAFLMEEVKFREFKFKLSEFQFQALVESCEGEGLAAEPNVRLVCLFDNEEVCIGIH